MLPRIDGQRPAFTRAAPIGRHRWYGKISEQISLNIHDSLQMWVSVEKSSRAKLIETIPIQRPRHGYRCTPSNPQTAMSFKLLRDTRRTPWHTKTHKSIISTL